jgi:hypothetical protein
VAGTSRGPPQPPPAKPKLSLAERKAAAAAAQAAQPPKVGEGILLLCFLVGCDRQLLHSQRSLQRWGRMFC